MLAAVYAYRVFGGYCRHCHNFMPGLYYQMQRIGQIVFFFYIVRLYFIQRLEQYFIFEAVIAWIYLFDSFLLSCAVALFDDALNVAIAVADNSAVAGS